MSKGNGHATTTSGNNPQSYAMGDLFNHIVVAEFKKGWNEHVLHSGFCKEDCYPVWHTARLF
jgi:hypothetical protein